MDLEKQMQKNEKLQDECESGPASIYGVGTRFYGHTEEWSDCSYVTTLWICIFYIPLIPLTSHRILLLYSDSFSFPPFIWSSSQKYLSAKVPLHKSQIAGVYFVVAVVLSFISLMLLAISH